MVADLSMACAIDPADFGDTDHTGNAVDRFAGISNRLEFRMPEKLVSGEFGHDGAAALYAVLDFMSPGKRGASGSLATDAELAEIFGVLPREIQRWRDRLERDDYCATVAVGRLARKCVGFGPDEQFIMVPALVVRALLTGEIDRLSFRLWVLITNTRIKYLGITGCWRGIDWFVKQLKRTPKTIKAALDRLVDAALLRIDDRGNGRGRMLVPQFARAVTQRMTAPVVRAARAVYRQAGLLKKPRLATSTPPSPDDVSTPPSDDGSAARSAWVKSQVATDSHASRSGHHLHVGNLNRGGLDQVSELAASAWRSVRNSLGKRE